MNFKQNTPLPLTEDEARNQGWELISDYCKGMFPGRRYINPNNVERTVLIYNINQKIAGMQMGFKASIKKNLTANTMVNTPRSRMQIELLDTTPLLILQTQMIHAMQIGCLVNSKAIGSFCKKTTTNIEKSHTRVN